MGSSIASRTQDQKQTSVLQRMTLLKWRGALTALQVQWSELLLMGHQGGKRLVLDHPAAQDLETYGVVGRKANIHWLLSH